MLLVHVNNHYHLYVQVQGGKQEVVTEDNLKQYMSLMSQYRKTENAVQAEMLHAGLSQIIPTDLLSMFTASEFRALVVGGSHISMEMLQVRRI